MIFLFHFYSISRFFAQIAVIYLTLGQFISVAKAQSAIDQQDWITRNQQNILEEKKRDDEFETIKKERELKKKEEEENKKPPSINISDKSKKCFPIKQINLVDADSLSWFRKKKLVAPFIGECLNGDTLSKIVTEVNNYYQSQGYVTTQIIVPQQNLQSGSFELKVIEGKVEEISFGENRVIEKMQKFTAFGNATGKTLNVNEINQGMYQINRLQSNSAIMKIEPGSKSGDSKVVIENNKKLPARVTIGKDNLGNQFTGVQRANFSSNIDNLLFLNDNLNLNYTANTHDEDRFKDLRAFSGSLSVPFKYETFSFDYSRSEFKGQNPGQNGPTTLTGFSDQRKFSLDHVLLSTSGTRLSANGSLTEKQSASYQDGVKILVSERSLSIMNVGLTLSSQFGNATNIYLKPSYSRGLKILNARKDQKNIAADAPKAQFEVFKFYANISQKLTIPKINAPVILSTEIDSQFAKETLFGSEQFSVGGYYSVRGFRENYITGDSGYYFRNKAGLNLGSLILPLFNQQNQDGVAQNFWQKNLSHLNKITIEPFYDFGYTRNKYNGTDGSLSGAGVKTIFGSRYFSASLTYSQGLQKSRLITSTTKENRLVYFEIRASCC